MKKSIFAFAAACALTGLAGCGDFLDTVPDNRTSLDSPDKIAALLGTAYPATTYITITDPRCDGYKDTGKAYAGDQALFVAIEDAFRWKEYNTSNGWDGVEEYWGACYAAIAAANHALVAIDQNIAQGHDKSEYTPYVGEALICRAYAHFCLLSLYSDLFDKENWSVNPGIPYVTEPEEVVIKPYERGTVASTLEKIQADLAEGLKYVGDAGTYAQPKFHFTRNSALALAARIALFTEDYNNVIYYVDQLIPNPTKFVETGNSNRDGSAIRFPAEDDVASVFVRNNLTDWASLSSSSQGDEFSLNYSSPKQNYNLLTREINTILPYATQANYFTRITYSPTIIERLASKNVTGVDWVYVNTMLQSSSLESPFIPKYYTDFKYDDVVNQTGAIYTKLPLFRMDELLLARAEAYAMLHKYDNALNDLNMYIPLRIDPLDYNLRTTSLTRNKIIDYYASQISGSGTFINSTYNADRFTAPKETLEGQLQRALVLTILDFRRIEFYMEGLRWFDILRWSIPVKHTMIDGSTSTLTPDDDRRLLQLPQTTALSGLEPNPMTNIPQPW